VTYTDKDPVEVTLGICENCSSYVPFIRLINNDDAQKVYQCMSCKAKHTQYVNGKVTFNYLEDAVTIKRN